MALSMLLIDEDMTGSEDMLPRSSINAGKGIRLADLLGFSR
jgi:hypothetical protein